MKLYFILSEVPRTTTREAWYKAWRDVRCMKHELAYHEESRRQLLHKPDTPPWVREQIVNEMIYPPLALGPFMQ